MDMKDKIRREDSTIKPTNYLFLFLFLVRSFFIFIIEFIQLFQLANRIIQASNKRDKTRQSYPSKINAGMSRGPLLHNSLPCAVRPRRDRERLLLMYPHRLLR